MPDNLLLLKYLFYVPMVVYLIIWLIMLLNCLKRRQFRVILLDSEWTRRFWLLTFVFMNPLLTLFYMIFGLRRPKQQAPAGVRNGEIVMVVAAFAIVAGFLVRFPGIMHLWMDPFIPGNPDSVINYHLAQIESKNSFNTTSSYSSTDNTRFRCNSLAIVCNGNNKFNRRIGKLLKDKLIEEKWLPNVEFYSDGRLPAEPTVKPDVFILLDVIQENVTA